MKAILVDIGGTILTRSKPGPKQRVIDVLRDHLAISRQESQEAADITLTAGSRDAAVKRLTRHFSLSQETANGVEAALREPEGEAQFIPGALDLIAACREKDIKIIYVTNAVSWAPALPVELMEDAAYVSSSSLGISKRDPQFWRTVLEAHGLDAQTCLSVGDSIENDVRPANQVGIAGIHIGEEGWDFAALAGTLTTADPSPAELDGFIAGPVNRITGYSVVECGHLANWVVDRTRSRAVIFTSGARIHGEVVRASDERSALFVTKTVLPESLFGWIKFERDRRMTNLPRHIEEKIAARGRTFKGLVDHEHRHYLSLLIEAASEEILEERLKAIIELLPQLPDKDSSVGSSGDGR
ncbi:HAD family hydrolase [Hoeflea sp. AS60]|uniref:HAD family hydrolase n=1 Tax=Hoeflea sp. AS60 TaxID=3135780 RepID=UPI0031729DEA